MFRLGTNSGDVRERLRTSVNEERRKDDGRAYYLFISTLESVLLMWEQKHDIRFQISIQIVDFIPILWNDP